MKKLFLTSLLFLFFSVTGTIAQAVAVDGYDILAYFENKIQKGNPNYVATIGQKKYFFVNETRLKIFEKNPNKYLPQYNGWCAYAMGQSGEKVEIHPEYYKITDGKLYLFYYRFYNNTLQKWNNNESKLKILADKNWAKIIENKK
jgi:YHS domain-containing protein